jgi:hypothetical protein
MKSIQITMNGITMTVPEDDLYRYLRAGYKRVIPAAPPNTEPEEKLVEIDLDSEIVEESTKEEKTARGRKPRITE